MKRISIFTGNFGSGKTEIAINYAVNLAKDKAKVALIDLDIVNPYFRSRDIKEEMAQLGVEVITPMEHLISADIPAITPRIHGVLVNQEYHVVIDVGGDDLGATALGRFHAKLTEADYQLFFVINPYRPFTSDQPGILSMFEEVEAASRLKVTDIISNPNLGSSTDLEIVLKGQQEVELASRKLQLPIAFTTIKRELYESSLSEQVGFVTQSLMPIDIYMHCPWDI